MLHVRIRKRVAGGLFSMDMRTVHGDTRDTDTLLETEIMGSLVFGIQVVDRCSTGSTNWHEMRLGSEHQYRYVSIQRWSHWLQEQCAEYISSCTSKTPLPLLIRYSWRSTIFQTQQTMPTWKARVTCSAQPYSTHLRSILARSA